MLMCPGASEVVPSHWSCVARHVYGYQEAVAKRLGIGLVAECSLGILFCCICAFGRVRLRGDRLFVWCRPDGRAVGDLVPMWFVSTWLP